MCSFTVKTLQEHAPACAFVFASTFPLCLRCHISPLMLFLPTQPGKLPQSRPACPAAHIPALKTSVSHNLFILPSLQVPKPPRGFNSKAFQP